MRAGRLACTYKTGRLHAGFLSRHKQYCSTNCMHNASRKSLPIPAPPTCDMPALLPLPAELLYTTSRMSRPASSCASARPRASSAGSAEAASPDSAWQYTEPTRPRWGASVAGASRSPATTWQQVRQPSTAALGSTNRQPYPVLVSGTVLPISMQAEHSSVCSA
jgi:hypothetical protein